MKKNKFPDIWGINKQSFFMDTGGRPKTTRPLVPIIPVRSTHGSIWINEQHDSDWDGVPNYRDCNILNPHEQGLFHKKKKRETRDLRDAPHPKSFDLRQDDFLQHINKLEVWAYSAKPVKHNALYNYLKSTIASGTTIGSEMYKFTEKEIAETLAYLNQKENIMIAGREKNGNRILFLREHYRSRGRPKMLKPDYTVGPGEDWKQKQKEFLEQRKQQEQYSMKRDTLALQMYDEHFSHLTPTQKRNVTREFNRMMQ